MYEFIKVSNEIYYVDGNPNQPTPKISLVVGDKYSLVIDTGNEPEQLRSLEEGIKKYNLPSIKYVVITHFHDDHIHNINYFKEKDIYSTKYTSKYIGDLGTIITGPFTLSLGNLDVMIDLLPNSHAKGSLLVYLPKEKVMFIGDALCGRIANDKMYLNRSLTFEMTKKIYSYDVNYFIDGHSGLSETTKEKVYGVLNEYKEKLKETKGDEIEIKGIY